MSNTVWIFRNWAILGMRELPMKWFRNNAVTREARAMVSTSYFRLLRGTVSTFRASRTDRAQTNCRFFSSKILPFSANGSTTESGLLAKNLGKCLTHVTRTNSFCADTSILASHPLRLTGIHSSQRHIKRRKRRSLAQNMESIPKRTRPYNGQMHRMISTRKDNKVFGCKKEKRRRRLRRRRNNLGYL